MSPPPLPLASPGGSIPASAPQNAHAAPHSPSLAGTVPSFDAAGVPMRHPRPLTAAELHLELEKEQEAVVNRLTRELSALRAHSASVASTTSSVTSGMHVDQDMMGATHPTSARRHRSSSSVSRTSTSAPYGKLPLLYMTHPLVPLLLELKLIHRRHLSHSHIHHPAPPLLHLLANRAHGSLCGTPGPQRECSQHSALRGGRALQAGTRRGEARE